MGKALVIVESPAKAGTINKYLGSDYVVKSSVGHIRDLYRHQSSKGKGKLIKASKEDLTLSENIKKMGVDPEMGWKAKYVTMAGKEKVITELKQLAKQADHIYLATDLDREGEAIAWHLQEVLGGDPSRYSRVTFNEITEKAIKEAFEQPRQIDLNLVHAQHTRRYLDRVVGFKVSPVLWKKIRSGLSAGRVQSVAVRLVSERENEINAFIPDEYWKLFIKTETTNKQPIKFQLHAVNDKVLNNDALQQYTNSQLRDDIYKRLAKAKYVVDSVVTKPTSVKPKAPFTTSTLQQSASTHLGFGVKRTMMAAQKLYEAGLITYMRTDSTAISDDAMTMVRTYIQSSFGDKYLMEQPVRYGNKANAQEAHECIRCTDCFKTLTKGSVEDDQYKLYHLIRSQFIASQMTPALYDSTTITTKVDELTFTAKGRVLLFDGFTKVMKLKESSNEEEQALPEVKQGETLTHQETIWERHYTKPPARYNEASLVKELEKRGIGRPSTYASIIGTIVDRGYVEIKDKRFHALSIGNIVTDRLSHSFPEMMDYDFTAKVEQQLDDIAHGKLDYLHALDQFWLNLSHRIEIANRPETEGGMPSTAKQMSGIACPACQREMLYKVGENGSFLGCSGFTDKEKPCKQTLPLLPKQDEEPQHAHRCTMCNKATKDYYVDNSRLLHVCEDVKCGKVDLSLGSYNIEGNVENGMTLQCDKCNGVMVEKKGRFGKYMHCEACNNHRSILADGTIAPPKKPVIDFPELKCQKRGSHFVLRETANGNIFLSAHNFPKCREMRSITVNELIQFKERLPEHLLYLTTGPTLSLDGKEETVVRYSKNKEVLYIAVPAFKGNKEVSFFIDGVWQPLYKPGQ